MVCIPAEIKECQSQEKWCYTYHLIAFPSIVLQRGEIFSWLPSKPLSRKDY